MHLRLDMLEQGFVLAFFVLVHLVQVQIALFRALERLAVVFGQGLGHPFVNWVGHQQDLIVL